MLALPFDAETLQHRLYVVDADPDPARARELLAELGRLDRSRTRATLVSIGGPYAEKDLVKGFGPEMVEWSRGSLEGRGPLSRVRLISRRVGELAPDSVKLLLQGGQLPWRAATAFSRSPPAAEPRTLPPGRQRTRIALVMKSDLSRNTAHVQQALHTARALASRGATVRIAAPLSGESFESLLASPGFDPSPGRIDHLPLKPVRRAVRTVRYLRSVLEELAAAGFGTLYFRQVRIGSMLLPAARQLGFRVFLEAHQPYTTWAMNERRRLWGEQAPLRHGHLAMARWDRRYERRCYLELTGVVCTTEALCRHVGRLAPGCPTLLLRNGAPEVDLPLETIAEQQRPLDLLYAGRTSSEKSTDVLLLALKRLEGVRLTIVGGPTERELRPYREMARDLGLADRVEFLPWEEQAALFRRIRQTKVAVHPLAGRGSREWRLFTCPLKVLECMALGTPVVATDLPALREIVTDGVTGRLAAPGDPEALASAIRELLDHPTLAESLRRAAHQHVRAFGHGTRADRLMNFLETCERTTW
ncbi:MAG: glycosyltransferase family 4 protein [Planctomycetota bacterium]